MSRFQFVSEIDPTLLAQDDEKVLAWEHRQPWGEVARDMRQQGWLPNALPYPLARLWGRAGHARIIRARFSYRDDEFIIGARPRYGVSEGLARLSAAVEPWIGDDLEEHTEELGRFGGLGAGETRMTTRRLRVRSAADGRFWVEAWTLTVANFMWVGHDWHQVDRIPADEERTALNVLSALSPPYEHELRKAFAAIVTLALDDEDHVTREAKLESAMELVRDRLHPDRWNAPVYGYRPGR